MKLFILTICIWVIHILYPLYARTTLLQLPSFNYYDSIPALKEIIISAPKRKIIKKGDTTIFNMDAFKNGSERKIEEVLAKLPGIHIHPDNGRISYMGQTIALVKIDGVDLLGSNYAVGTRNISAAAIESVEAIENDPLNPLLKSMQSNGQMVLNLKTKKSVHHFNGDLSVGSGWMGNKTIPHDAQINLLGLSGRLKSFTAAASNNRGLNHASFNYFQEASVSQLSNNKERISGWLDLFRAEIPVGHQRYNINDQKMITSNILFQPGSNERSLRLNFFIMGDEQHAGHDQYSHFYSTANAIKVSDKMQAVHHPFHIETEVEWKQLLSPTCWLQYRSGVQSGNNLSRVMQVMNDTAIIEGKMLTQNMVTTHEIDITKKINSQKAFRSVLSSSSQKISEQLAYNMTDLFNHASALNKQEIITQRFDLDYSGIFLYKKPSSQYELTTELHYGRLPGNKWIRSLEHLFWSQTGTASIRRGGVLYQPKISVSGHIFSYQHQKEHNVIRQWVVIQPSFTITQKMGPVLKWLHQAGIHYQPIASKPNTREFLMISPRVGLMQDVAPDLQKIYTLRSTLVYQDLYSQQQGQLDIQFNAADKTVTHEIMINERLTNMRMMQLARVQKRFQIHAQYEVYLQMLRSTFIVEGRLISSNYFNQVNTKNIRENQSYMRTFNLQYKSSFKSPFNFTYLFGWSRNRISIPSAEDQINIQTTQSLQLIWQLDKFLFVQCSADWYRPQYRNIQTIAFMDALIRYKPKEKRYAFSLTACNLLNQIYFMQTQLFDYGMTITQTRLMPAHLLANIEYRF